MSNNRARPAPKRAVVLLSGGLDSATTLYIAKKKGFRCFCLIFDYGQRHRKEIPAARKIAEGAGCPWQVLKIHFPWKGSSLLDARKKIPGCSRVLGFSGSRVLASNIPSTYVPARNIIFLSFALSYAEVISARAIFIGAHSQDYSGYPDCRPQFFQAFQKVAAAGTKCGVEKKTIKIEAPLIEMNKAQIIRLGVKLGVPLELTWSCYRGTKTPCGKCDSCRFRAKGFRESGIRGIK
jgi:7-cyano-7-deazaguanine synthase